MHEYGDYTMDNVDYLVMIPMLHGDKTNAASRLNSTSQTKVSIEENIIQVEYSPLKYRRMDND